MLQRTKVVIDSYKDHETYLREFLHVFTLCAQCQNDLETPPSVAGIAETSARGLEIQILAVLDRYRSKHVESVLLAQDKYSNVADLEKRRELLAARSIQCSRPGRALARVLGNSDELILRL